MSLSRKFFIPSIFPTFRYIYILFLNLTKWMNIIDKLYPVPNVVVQPDGLILVFQHPVNKNSGSRLRFRRFRQSSSSPDLLFHYANQAVRLGDDIWNRRIIYRWCSFTLWGWEIKSKYNGMLERLKEWKIFLTTTWVRSKSDPVWFWKMKPTVSEPWLSAVALAGFACRIHPKLSPHFFWGC